MQAQESTASIAKHSEAQQSTAKPRKHSQHSQHSKLRGGSRISTQAGTHTNSTEFSWRGKTDATVLGGDVGCVPWGAAAETLPGPAPSGHRSPHHHRQLVGLRGVGVSSADESGASGI
jgi:hypothetical protein